MSQNNTHRIDYLDAVRGIAATMVVFYHFNGWHHGTDSRFYLSSIIFNGSDAVSFFFVLSGFVLSYKYFHKTDKDINIGAFIYKRIFRLYPAYIFTVLTIYYYRAGFSFSFNNGLIPELQMVKMVHALYGPGWTLGVELALSFLMPFIVLIARNKINYIWWLVPISMVIEPFVSIFTFHFLLGTLLAYYYPQIKSFNFKEQSQQGGIIQYLYIFRYWIYFIIFILFSLRHIEKIVGFGPNYDFITGLFNVDMFHYTGLASCFILLIIINNKKIQTFLNHRILIFIGKISYGIYLMHWLIVLHVKEKWAKWTPYFPNENLQFIGMLLIVLLLTFISATFIYYCIEKPFINFGRKKYKWHFWLKEDHLKL